MKYLTVLTRFIFIIMYTDSKGIKTYKLNRQSQNIIYILQLLLYTDIKLIEMSFIVRRHNVLYCLFICKWKFVDSLII